MNPFLPSLKICRATALTVLLTVPAGAQLFDNLQTLSNRVSVGNPRYEQDVWGEWDYLNENPKGLATSDFDGDGHADWVVSRLDGRLVFAYGKGDGTFDLASPFPTPAGTFRQLLAADLNGDAKPDLAGCDPFTGTVYLFVNNGTRSWAQPLTLAAWEGARNLASGDFDGDGVADLIVAGPDRNQAYDWVKHEPILPPPPGPQPAHGVAFYRGLGGGAFAAPTYVPALATVGEASYDREESFPRPIYSLKTWRPAGTNRDRLVAAHALSGVVTVLGHEGAGGLKALQTLQSHGKGIRALALGPLYHGVASGVPDLVVANRDAGFAEVFRGDDPLGFASSPSATYSIPLGPRALELADLNRNGWLDLIVAQREGHKLTVWNNSGDGHLALASETATGWSPREMVQADFDEDGRTDFAVLNRDSADVSILLADKGAGPARTGFQALDQIYPTPGDVAQLAVQDLNGDGRADVLQLHRQAGEVSIRLSLPGGKLGPASFFKMGARPESLSLSDANNDGKPDLVTTNVGDALGGLYTVRLADGAGSFGPPVTYRPPVNQSQFFPHPSASLPAGVTSPLDYPSLFSVLSVDLDGDGIKDLIAGYYDCRGAVFKGRGDGTYVTPPRDDVFQLAYESRFMVYGDFDQDGDQDIAVCSWTGAVVVLENTGNFFRTNPALPQFIRHDYPISSQAAGARELVARDFDGDGDLDLVSASGEGVLVLLGRAGATFERKTFPSPRPDGAPVLTVPGLTFPVQTMAWGRFDANDSYDLATICQDDGCLRISTYDKNNPSFFGEALVVDCPQTDYLQTGDVDGDGLTDLVGTGAVLWVALSGHAAGATPPLAEDSARPPPIPGLVINEILANNDNILINLAGDPSGFARPSFFGKAEDCVELYNGSAEDLSLAGWKLTYTADDVSQVFLLPAETIPAGGFRVILCYDKPRTGEPWRSGFTLAKEGGVLRLSRPAGETADAVTYPALGSDQSYARFSDGDVSWHLSDLPNPGFPNASGAPVEPKAKLNGIDLAEFVVNRRVRFYATATDDLGVVGMTIRWRQIGQKGPFRKVVLYDDGLQGDGGRLDGVFSGVFTEAPEAGTPVEFYLEGEDLSGSLTRLPGPPPDASDESGPTPLYTLTMPGSVPAPTAGLEISEMMPAGSTLADPTGVPANWVEIRNTSGASLSLDGIELADSLFDGGARAVFPEGLSLAPGEHRLVWARPLALAGVLSGDLKLSSGGEELALVRRDAAGSQQLLSYFQAGAVPRGLSAARVGAGGPVLVLPPTPGTLNVRPQTLVPVTFPGADGFHVGLVYPTAKGVVPAVEWNHGLAPENWFPLDLLPGDGYERLFDEAQPERVLQRFFRLKP